MPAVSRQLPEAGGLAEHPLRRVVLELWRRGYTGGLTLTHGSLALKVTWLRGAPVGATLNREDDSLGDELLAREQITAEQLKQARAVQGRKAIPEAAALLAVKAIEPRDLVQALRGQLLRRFAEAFGWPEGRFALDADVAPAADAEAFRVDPAQVLQEGLTRFVRPDLVLGDLHDRMESYAATGDGFATFADRLIGTPEVASVQAAIDPTRRFAEALCTSLEPARLAVVWLFAESGALEFHTTPPDDDVVAPTSGGAPPELEIQIEVRSQPQAGEETGAQADVAQLELPSPEAEALRKDLLALHERLDEIDHYEVLGIEADAAGAAVKKAYFACAKRFHPDAVSRLGLAAIHREANELFARIAQAYQTLSNPAQRQAYDQRSENDAPATDANRIAQAETLFRKGEVMIKVGNFASALDFLRPCVELWPEEADYQGALGWALYKNKPSDPAAAREHLEKADALRGDDPLLLFRLGMVMRKLGETEAGQMFLDRSKALERAAKA